MITVIDASALAGWLLPDEDGIDLGPILSDERVTAPWLLWAELRNILIMVERRNRLTRDEVTAILAAVEDLGLTLDTVPDGAHVMSLARRHRLTVYDALYLELALRRGGTLISLDHALIRAAQAENVVVPGGQSG